MITLVVSAGLLLSLLVRLNDILVVYGDISGLESTSVVYFIQKYISGAPIYTDPEAAPFAICPYTPLYYWVTGAIGKLFQVNVNEPMEVFRLSRIVSLLSNLLTLLVTAYMLLRMFKLPKLLVYWTVSLLFLFVEPQLFSRPDSMYLLFFVLSMVSMFRFIGSAQKHYPTLAVGAVFSVLAILSKQTGIIIPLLVVFYLLFFQKDFRSTIVYLFSFGLAFAISLLGIDDLGLFYKNVVKGVDNGMTLLWYYKYIWSGYFPLILPIIILSLGISVTKLMDKNAVNEHFWAYATLVVFLFANVTSLKYGSGPNYFQEFIFMSMVTVAYYLFPKVRTMATAESSRVLHGVALLVVVMLVGLQGSRLVFDFRFSDRVEEYEAARKVRDYLQTDGTNDEDVLVFVSGWVEKNFVINFLHNRTIMVNKDIYGCCAYPRKVFDVSAFKRSMRSGAVRYIVLPEAWSQIVYLDEVYDVAEPVYVASPYKICLVDQK